MISYRHSFSKVLVFSSFPNSTYDLYIASRLSSDAQVEVVDHTCKILEIGNNDLKSTLIIINRYITSEIINWLDKNRSEIAKIIWLVDDDFYAMATSFDIPIRNKVRPLITQLYKGRLRRLCDHVLVSTNKLCEKFTDWSVSVVGPIADIEQSPRALDTSQLYYFSKMHSSEHRFLFPIIQKVLSQNPQSQLTVIANDRWRAKWKSLNRVTVLPEMPYLEYQAFLRGLPVGGIFLVPLMDTKLNASRSDAKLIDAAKSGSAVLVSNHIAYGNFLSSKFANMHGVEGVSSQGWVKAISDLIEDQTLAESNKDAVSNYLKTNYENRQIIC